MWKKIKSATVVKKKKKDKKTPVMPKYKNVFYRIFNFL